MIAARLHPAGQKHKVAASAKRKHKLAAGARRCRRSWPAPVAARGFRSPIPRPAGDLFRSVRRLKWNPASFPVSLPVWIGTASAEAAPSSSGLCSQPPSWREFHWLALAGDLLIPAAVLVVVLRWLHRCGAAVEKTHAVLLVGFTLTFVWLNIDYWIGGLPVTWIGSQSDIRFMGQARRGFPFPYDGVLPFPDWQWSALLIDVTIGITGWAALYSARSVARVI